MNVMRAYMFTIMRRCNHPVDIRQLSSIQPIQPSSEAGLRVYALDLLGNGYTDKLDPTSEDG